MKLFSKIAAVAIGISCCGLVQAGDGSDYSKVVSIGGNGVTIRDTESNWFYGFNYSLSEADTDYQGSDTTHDLSVTVGRRFYLNNDDVKSFIDSEFGVLDNLSSTSRRSYRVFTGYGIEAFVSSAMSVGGSVGVSLNRYESEDYNNTSLSGPSGRLFVSYYFN